MSETSTGRNYWKLSGQNLSIEGETGNKLGKIKVATWSGLPNLKHSRFNSKEELASHLHQSSNKGRQAASRASEELWIFLQLMKQGDLVCVVGPTTLLAWGRIAGDYDFRAGVHSRKIEWISNRQRPVGHLMVGFDSNLTDDSPIVKLSAKLFNRLTGQNFEESQNSQRVLVDASPAIQRAIPDQTVPAALNAKTNMYKRFDLIMQDLKDDGLYFVEELVGNYLLALQTKRFAILSGISGTGKTQLARAVAKHFQQAVLVPQLTIPSDEAQEVTVRPYMLDHQRMQLPPKLIANAAFPEMSLDAASRQIRAVYPGGEQLLTYTRETGRDVSYLLFKGAFKSWFREEFRVGDRFTIELVDSGEEVHRTIKFCLPTYIQREEILDNYRVVAVRPDWSDNRGLLGYFNPLVGSYITTPFLRFLLEAQDEVARAQEEDRDPAPFFAILDEMNLARVEHYFSDFLSALESEEPIHLHDHTGIAEGETEDGVAVPKQLPIPGNVFFTGTVNVDETTYMFSPKVLDRAFTIELNQVDLATFGRSTGAADDSFRLSRLPDSLVPARKPETADWSAFGKLLNGELQRVVVALHDLLSAEDRHFGYRVATEIARFVNLASEQTDGSKEALWTALDLTILQKVLPKFHGTQQELEGVLSTLLEFVEQRPLTRTAAKLRSMQRRLLRQGFTSFIE